MSALAGKPAGVYEVPAKHEAQVYVYSRELMELCQRYCGTGSADEAAAPRDLMELPPARQRLLVDTLPPRRRQPPPAGERADARPRVDRSRTLAFQLQEILARTGHLRRACRSARRSTRRCADGAQITHREQYNLHFEEGRTVNQVWFDAGRNCFWVPIRKIESAAVRRLGLQPRDGQRPERLPGPRLRGPQLHGPDLRHGFAPCRGRRGRRAAGSKVRYTTIQNWSNDVYNLVTKRAHAHENSHGRVDRREYRLAQDREVPEHLPARRGRHARTSSRSPSPARASTRTPARRPIHLAPNTTSPDRLASPSPRTAAGRPTAASSRSRRAPPNVVASVRCDALMLDDDQPERHVPVHRHPGRRHDDDPRGHRRARSARTRSST